MVAVSGLIGAGLAVTAAPASAAHIACGSIITANTTLDSDVGPCPGDGLNIKASGITLNLNGHRVFASNGPGDHTGIRVSASKGVTVMGGTVEGFDDGVGIHGGSGNKVTKVKALNNINDLVGAECELGDGISIFNSSNNVINMNEAIHNGPFGGISVVGNSDNNRISNNVARDNNVQGPGCGNLNQDEGIRIEGPGADNNVVSRNTVESSLLAGISLHGYVCGDPAANTLPNTGSIVLHNSVTGTAGAQSAGIAFLQQGPTGIVCAAYNATIEANTSTGNAGDGIFVARSSHDNRINRNTVSNNGTPATDTTAARGAGIFLNTPRDFNTFTNVGPSLLDVVTPDRPPYVENTDYGVLSGSGSGDVTAPLVAVGAINIPPPGFDTSTSGCSPADFVGFPVGAVALVQRGFCARADKVTNALAAGASAVVLFNEGTPGREGIPPGVDATTIPVVGTTYAVGVELYNLTKAGPVSIHVVTNTTNVPTTSTAHDNLLTNNTGFNNALVDGFDGNLDPPCDNNTWRNNHFGTVNQACVDNAATVPMVPLRAAKSSGGRDDAVEGVNRNSQAASNS